MMKVTVVNVMKVNWVIRKCVELIPIGSHEFVRSFESIDKDGGATNDLIAKTVKYLEFGRILKVSG